MTVNRRTALAGVSLAAAALAPGAAQAQGAAPKTYVLVHGAYGGGWIWRDVAAGLRGRGHRVFTPTQTGLGERSHLLSRQITVDTHIDDVASVFAFEDLRDVVLVGHSYGGMAVTGSPTASPTASATSSISTR